MAAEKNTMAEIKIECQNHHHHQRASGPSSFGMHDDTIVFNALDLKPGDCFLDLGCGPGDYALAASWLIGPAGTVYALDRWPYMVDSLKARAFCQNIYNISALVGDITDPLPFEGDIVDICLLATVLHIFQLAVAEKGLFREIRRILKPGGRLAVIECKKEEQPFGPPKHLRLSPRQLETALGHWGFETIHYTDLGYTYLIQFTHR